MVWAAISFEEFIGPFSDNKPLLQHTFLAFWTILRQFNMFWTIQTSRSSLRILPNHIEQVMCSISSVNSSMIISLPCIFVVSIRVKTLIDTKIWQHYNVSRQYPQSIVEHECYMSVACEAILADMLAWVSANFIHRLRHAIAWYSWRKKISLLLHWLQIVHTVFSFLFHQRHLLVSILTIFENWWDAIPCLHKMNARNGMFAWNCIYFRSSIATFIFVTPCIKNIWESKEYMKSILIYIKFRIAKLQ